MILDQNDIPQGPAPRKPRKFFTGEFTGPIVSVNPNKEEYIDLKGLHEIADKIKEPQYKDTSLGGNEYFTKLQFFVEIDPNRILNAPDGSFEKIVEPYTIFVNNTISKNKDGSKVQVIDDRNQNAWIPYRDGATPTELFQELLEDVTKAGRDSYKDYLNKFNQSTLRFARKGEVTLYDFLFKITNLPRHGSTFTNTQGEKEQYELANFVLGGDPVKASEEFAKVVNNDLSYIRKFLSSPMVKDSADNLNKIGGLLGVRVNDSDPENIKFYQEIFSHPFDACVFREYARENTIGEHTTRFPESIYNRIVDEQYPWRHIWQNSFEFQEFNTSSYKPASTNEEGADDDLPF